MSQPQAIVELVKGFKEGNQFQPLAAQLYGEFKDIILLGNGL